MFEHVIVGIDGTDGGLDAVALAGRLGARRMTLVGAYRVDGVPPDVLLARYDQILREDTLAGLAAARAAAGRDAALLAIGDAPDRALQRVADDAGADLICIGSSRHGRLGRILPGDVARGVLQRAPCPVAIAPRGYAGHARPISRIFEIKKLFLFFRNFHIIDGNRNTTKRCIIETKVLQSVGENYGTFFTSFPETFVNHLSDGLLVHNPVDKTEHIFNNYLSFRCLKLHECVFDNISQDYPARRRVHIFPIRYGPLSWHGDQFLLNHGRLSLLLNLRKVFLHPFCVSCQ